MRTSLHLHAPRAGAPPADGGRRGGMLDIGRLLIGLVAVAVGVLYVLDSADALDAGEAVDGWWPTIIIAVGILQLLEGTRAALGPLILVGGGTALLLVTTGVLSGSVWSYVWPMALICLGVLAIARWAGAGRLPAGTGDDVVRASGVFGGPTVASSSRHFMGATLTAVFGGVVLDLRGAQPAPEGARVSATAVFGGVDILVPRGWRVSVRGTPFFGGVDDKTVHDQDLPEDAPLLSVDALAAFGGVALKHER